MTAMLVVNGPRWAGRGGVVDPRDIQPSNTEDPLGCLGWLLVALFIVAVVVMALTDGQ